MATAINATESVAAALITLRPHDVVGLESGDQLKTWVDRAAEGWVLGYLEAAFPSDAFLAEERYADEPTWNETSCYWTIDALDGTRSYVDGFDGFCVQVAFVESGAVQLGVIFEPVQRTCYFAIRGMGAYRRDSQGKLRRLVLEYCHDWPPDLVFVDSTPPAGDIGDFLQRHGGRLMESGSIGVKICRVADGSAQLFLKALAFKLWDVAPGHIILEEAGGSIGTWNGKPIRYDTNQIAFQNLVAAPHGLLELVQRDLQGGATLD